MTAAPDYPVALVGWRSWSLAEIEGVLRLCSPSFATVWLPGRETVAVCKHRSWNGRVAEAVPHRHDAPEEACTCGIYASRSAVPAAGFLIDSALALRRPSPCVLLGRVRLWGRVVETEEGWRGERAYPHHLYLLEQRPRILEHRGSDLEATTAELVRALERYGVPVELVAAESLLEFAEHSG